MADRQTMNVSLTAAQERFVRSQVESGRFRSASEVLRHGLKLLELEEHRQLLERWLMNQLSDDEERQLPPKVVEKARARLREFVDEGLRSADDGWVDSDAVKANVAHRPARRRGA